MMMKRSRKTNKKVYFLRANYQVINGLCLRIEKVLFALQEEAEGNIKNFTLALMARLGRLLSRFALNGFKQYRVQAA